MNLLRSIKGQVSAPYLIVVCAVAIASVGGAERIGLGLQSAIGSTANATAARTTNLPTVGGSAQAGAGSAARVFLDVTKTAKQLKRSAARSTPDLTLPRRTPGAKPTTNPTKFKVVLENEETAHLGSIHGRLLEGKYSATDGPANEHFEVVQSELLLPRDFDEDFGTSLLTDNTLIDRMAALSSFYHQTKFFNAIEELMDVTIEQIHGRPVKLRPTGFDGFNAYYNSQSGEIVYGKARRSTPPSADPSQRATPAGVEALPRDNYVRMGNGLTIPSHEAFHLYRQGLAPDWARDLQSRGHGEFGGDLSSIFMATQDAQYRAAILAETGGDLRKDSPLTRLGVSVSVGVGEGPGGMRNALHSISMSDVNGRGPHDLSKPLTGAAYDGFVGAYDSLRRDYKNHADANVKAFADELAMINAGRLIFWVHDTSLRKLAGSRPVLRYHELVDDMASVAKSPANEFGDAGKALASELVESAKQRGILSQAGDYAPHPTAGDDLVIFPGANDMISTTAMDGTKKPFEGQRLYTYLPVEGN